MPLLSITLEVLKVPGIEEQLTWLTQTVKSLIQAERWITTLKDPEKNGKKQETIQERLMQLNNHNNHLG
jgi:hypothetical protein